VAHCVFTGRAKSRRFVYREGKAGRFTYEKQGSLCYFNPVAPKAFGAEDHRFVKLALMEHDVDRNSYSPREKCFFICAHILR
jgi:hypothetical protein